MSSLPGEGQPTAAAEVQPYGEVFDLGYRHYEGRREGRAHAIRALVLYSVKRGLGIKKRWTAKIIPFGLYVVSFLPVIVIIGVKALLGPIADQVRFSYFNLYEMLTLIILLFAAGVAPEMICDDRREHVLQVYFARAISRLDYLLAKIGAMGFLIGTIAFLPALLLFLGYTFLASSPVEYFGDHFTDLGAIMLAGTLVALFYGAIATVVAVYIDRKGIASATTVGGTLIMSAIASALFATVEGEWHRYFVLADPLAVPQGFTKWIFSATRSDRIEPIVLEAGLPDWWYLLAVAAVVAICGLAMYRRYLMED